MISHTQWFDAIKMAIKNKYKIENPIFLIDNEKIDKANFDEWLKSNACSPDAWLKYKHIENNAFELKPFTPDPNDKISLSLIDDYLQSIPQTNKEILFTVTYVESDGSLIEGDSWYDIDEIKIELRYLFRIGQSKISFYKQETEIDNKTIYHLLVEEDSLENMIKSGYLTLEYSS